MREANQLLINGTEAVHKVGRPGDSEKRNDRQQGEKRESRKKMAVVDQRAQLCPS